VEAAFKCLFLSRTSFSGVLHSQAGPIGGQRQKSAYNIDCRFPRDLILKRLDSLHARRGQVAYAGVRSYSSIVRSMRVQRFFNEDSQRVVWYLDPPFFRKADKLYNFTFDVAAHRRFRDFVYRQLPGQWIVSYDDVPEARALWSGSDGISKALLTYSASSVARRGDKRHKRSESRELIMSSFFQHTKSEGVSLRGRHRDHNRRAHLFDHVLS
jgi:DNA adenine methylase